MLLLGTIQKVRVETTNDKGKEGKLIQLVIVDSSRPTEYRTATPFVMFIGERVYEQLGGTKGDISDEKVTVVINEVGNYNNLPKLRGQIVLGHHAGEALTRMLAGETPGQPKPEGKPAAAVPAAK